MNKFIESIRCENSQVQNLSYHQDRVDKAFNTFFPGSTPFQLADIQPPLDLTQGVYKCRILYSDSSFQIEYIPYQFPKISSLKLVFDNNIDYSYKLENRAAINSLYQQKANADDVLIIKNGYVTDASYTNVAFWDGQQWFTPSTPLLAGTMRQYLLDHQVIKSRLIHYTDIFHFQSLKLFNAMIPFDEGPEIATSRLIT